MHVPSDMDLTSDVTRGARAGRRAIAALPLLVLLAACNPYQTAGLVAVNAISYLETDKGVGDHIMSKMMHKDCAAERILTDGKIGAATAPTPLAPQGAPSSPPPPRSEAPGYPPPTP